MVCAPPANAAERAEQGMGTDDGHRESPSVPIAVPKLGKRDLRHTGSTHTVLELIAAAGVPFPP